MNVLLVCQAGPGVGLGHLARCLVAAKALRDAAGLAPCLLIQGAPLRRPDLDAFPHRFVDAGADLCAEALAEAHALDARALLFDLQPRLAPQGLAALFAALRADGRKLVAIDGLLEHAELLDLIFIPSFRVDVPAGIAAPVRYGWDCYLLNGERGEPRPWRPGGPVLALTGGSDATGLGATLPAMLDATLPSGSRIDWVTGPYAAPPEFPACPRTSIAEHKAPAGLGPLMARAGYALTVFGVSFFELLAFGVPTVVFSPYGDKDDRELGGIAAAGVALVAGDEARAVALLAELMTDEARARELSRRALQTMRAPGGETLAQAVKELLA